MLLPYIMRRKLLNLATAVSALLLATTLAAWAWSHTAAHTLLRKTWDPVERRATIGGLQFAEGCVSLKHRYYVVDDPLEAAALASRATGKIEHAPSRRRTDLLPPWYYAAEEFPGGKGELEIRMPLWPIALVTAILPAVWARRYMRRPRLNRPGCCRTCGYDLRGSPERCPECGATTAAS